MAANPIDLTTVAEVKAFGVLAGCNLSDGVIQDLITSASQYWLNRTGLATLNHVESYEENYDGNGNSVLGLDNQKIISISSVYVNNSPIQPSSSANQPGYYIDRQGRFIGIRGYGTGGRYGGQYTFGSGSPGQGSFATFGRACNGGAFVRGQNNVAVSYTAGFIYPVASQPQMISGSAISLDLYAGLNAWYSDQGVVHADTGVAFVLVPVSPSVGEYTVNQYGDYGFNTADNGTQVLVSFTYQGPPSDVYAKVTKQVCTEIKRLGTLDQEQQNLDGGSRRYFTWDVSPDIEAVIQSYARRARA